MAFLAREDPEDLVVCPYDDTHMISHKRFQYHVTECKKNNPHIRLTDCPFNARHKIRSEEFQHHIANCPDKEYIEKETAYLKRKGEVELGGYLKVPDYNDTIHVESTEDWDAEATAPPFILGETQHPNFTPHSGPHLAAFQPDPQHIPGLTHEYVYQKPKNVIKSSSSPSFMDQSQGSLQVTSHSPQAQLRAPRQQPKSMQQTVTPALGRGRGLAMMANPAPQKGIPAPQQSWTAVGRGRGRFNNNSGDSTVPKTNVTTEPLRLPHSMGRGSSVNTSSMNGVTRTVNTPGFVIPGRARGRGIMSINKSVLMPGRSSPTVSMSTDSPLSSDTGDQFDSDIEREKLKEERKIRKRLKQIEVLQQRQASGDTLSKQEIEKIEKRDNLLQQLSQLKMVED